MMFLQREKINYLCKKYNLKVCRLGDTFKLFIHSSIFPAIKYWYIFANEDLKNKACTILLKKAVISNEFEEK